jgi:hypothetical protein
MNREEVSLQGKDSSSPNVDGMFSKHMHTHTHTHTHDTSGIPGGQKSLAPIHPHPFPRPGRRRLAPCMLRGREFGSLVWFHHVGSSIHPGKTKLRLKGRMDASRGSEASRRRRGSSSQPRDFRPELALFNASGMTWMARRRQIDRLVG